MFERFTKAARDVVGCALLEAQRRGEHRVGTQHLLLGLLRQGSTAPGAVGADLAAARAALDELDRDALAAVGVDIDAAVTATGPEAAEPTKVTRLPFTAGAKAVLVRSLREAQRDHGRALTTDHLLLALVDTQPPDVVLDLLARLGSSPALVRERLRPAA